MFNTTTPSQYLFLANNNYTGLVSDHNISEFEISETFSNITRPIGNISHHTSTLDYLLRGIIDDIELNQTGSPLLTGETTELPDYKVFKAFTGSEPKPSFSAFAPHLDLGGQTARTGKFNDSILPVNHDPWNKKGFNISFNFSANLSLPDWNTTQTANEASPNWILLALCIIPTWILFGNLLVLLAVIFHRNLRTLSNLVIASLAVTDFLLALIVVPFGTYQVVSKSILNMKESE